MREFESLYEFGDSKYCEKEEICVDMVRERSSYTGVANVVQTPIDHNSVFIQARTYLRLYNKIGITQQASEQIIEHKFQ